ncbi:MAG: 3-methyl-2-oxobutanoate hydroxymethyltransferase [Vicinamibacterales bacterium]
MLADLLRMKRDRVKIVAVVVYDFQMAQIVDRAGVDIVSVGDSVGVNMWGQPDELAVTLDQMLLACTAVRRGVRSALVSCDMPYGPLQSGPEAAVAAARRLVDEGGADLVKLDAAPDFPVAVAAVANAGIPVWGQFGITPHTAARHGGMQKAGPELVAALANQFVAEAKLLEQSGAALLDFTHSGPVAGPAVTEAVGIPVLGGLGGGPWLDGRIRAVGAAIGYQAAALDDGVERYANVARVAFDAIQAFATDVRAGRQIRGAAPPREKDAIDRGAGTR